MSVLKNFTASIFRLWHLLFFEQFLFFFTIKEFNIFK